MKIKFFALLMVVFSLSLMWRSQWNFWAMNLLVKMQHFLTAHLRKLQHMIPLIVWVLAQ